MKIVHSNQLLDILFIVTTHNGLKASFMLLFSVEESTDLHEAVSSVVAMEKKKFLNGKSAFDYNECFLEKFSNLSEHRISGE